MVSSSPFVADARRTSSAAATNSRWCELSPVHAISSPARARSISSRWWSARPSSSVGWRRHRSASASTTGAYGHAPSTGADVPWPDPEAQLPGARARSRASSDDLPMPAGPPTIRVRLRPAGRVEQRALGDGQLEVAPDQRVVAARRRRRARRAAGRAAPRPRGPGATPSSRRSVAVEALELAQRGVAVAVGGVPAHQREVGDLVAGVELDDRLPAAVEAQQVEVAEAELLAALLGPRLVAVLGQQLAAVQRERLAGRGDVLVGQRAAGELLEPNDVDVDVGVGAAGRRARRAAPRSRGTPMARRAKCAALCSFGAASSIVSSGHTRSMTCSRCSRRPGARASTFTSAAAWRRRPVALGDGARRRPSRRTDRAV